MTTAPAPPAHAAVRPATGLPAPPAEPAQKALRGLPPRIGKYLVRSKLGEGSTSEVFLAWDEFRQREVAIKRVRAAHVAGSHDAHFQQRFFAAEAALVGRLQHPNVVQILDAVSDADGCYLVMEAAGEMTLRRFCRANNLLSVPQVLEVAFKCAMALAYCQRQGLIHRDVKPANVLVQMNGERITELKLTDFGSVFNAGAENTQIYRVGSLAYMSPEQLDGDDLDGRADMYSLAAVMYHLLAGRPPFDASHQQALMQQIFRDAPPPLDSLRDGVPPGLQRLIESSLAKDRQLRPPDWDSFAQALSALSSHEQVLRGPLIEVMDAERYTLLRRLPFFEAFGDVELWEVVRRAHWQRHGHGEALFRTGQAGRSFHVLTQGRLEVYRDGSSVASLAPGATVGEMAYLAPSPELRLHTVDVLVAQAATTLSFVPETLALLSLQTRSRFDQAFIGVLVRRLHAAHEALVHPRRIF